MDPFASLEQQVRAHWLRLRQAEVAVGDWHARVSTESQAAFQQRMAEIQAADAQARAQAEEACRKRQLVSE